jgi:hypothetical protein
MKLTEFHLNLMDQTYYGFKGDTLASALISK